MQYTFFERGGGGGGGKQVVFYAKRKCWIKEDVLIVNSGASDKSK